MNGVPDHYGGAAIAALAFLTQRRLKGCYNAAIHTKHKNVGARNAQVGDMCIRTVQADLSAKVLKIQG
jgi:hypothetical protein